MRLLFTTFTYAPQVNGVAEVVGAQARGLAERGHKVTVATGEDPYRVKSMSNDNPCIIEFKINHGGKRDRLFEEEKRRYQNFISTFPVDIILCHCWGAWSTDLAVAALPRNAAKTVIISHGYNAHRWTPRRKFAWGLGEWLRAQPYLLRTFKMLRSVDHIVFLSPRIDGNRFFDHWLVNRLHYPRWSAIPNGAFPAKFSDATIDFRRAYQIGKKFLVLYVAAYHEGKNQETALRAYVRADPADSILVFIGYEMNNYARRLQDLYEASRDTERQGSVRFLEKLDQPTIRSAYRAADLFLMSSRAETQPLVILDAMAYGKPFLATRVGCIDELPGGRVVRNEVEMAGELLRLRGDPQLLQTLGRAAFEACRTRYNWDLVIEAYEGLFAALQSRTFVQPQKRVLEAPAG